MIFERETPSGLRIRFEDGQPDPKGQQKRRQYWINDEKVPSITTVLGVLGKDGMAYAAEKLTVAACVELAQGGMSAFSPPAHAQDSANVIKALDVRQQRFAQQWATRALVGTEVHDHLEQLLAGDRTVLDVSPLADPYVEGVMAFIDKYKPRTVQSEVMLGSAKYKVAGRFDWLGMLDEVPVPSDELIRLDLKTTDEIPRDYRSNRLKPPYESYLAQLCGYELCAEESGDPVAKYHAVLRVDKTGDFNLWLIERAPASMYLAIRDCYQAVKDLAKLPRVAAEVAA